MDSKSDLPLVLKDKPVLARLWTYWNDARGNRPMPPADEIGAARLPDIAPNMLEIEVLGDGGFAYRFVGGNLITAYGFDPTGRRVDAALNAARGALARRIYALTVKSRRPLFASNRYLTPRPETLGVDRIVCPAANDDERIRLLISAQTFTYEGEIAGELGNQATLEMSGDAHVFLDEELQ